MKKYLLILFCLLSCQAFSQDNIVFRFGQQLLLKYNYFDVFADSIPKDSLLVTTDNGTIEKINDFYRITPVKLGPATISVFRVSRHDTTLFQKKRCFVVGFQDYTVAILNAGWHEGTIEKTHLLASSELLGFVENLDIQINLRVKSFRIIILRNDSLVFTKQYYSYEFDESIFNAFNLTQAGDLIYFVDIKAVEADLDKTEIRLHDLILKINN